MILNVQPSSCCLVCRGAVSQWVPHVTQQLPRTFADTAGCWGNENLGAGHLHGAPWQHRYPVPEGPKGSKGAARVDNTNRFQISDVRCISYPLRSGTRPSASQRLVPRWSLWNVAPSRPRLRGTSCESTETPWARCKRPAIGWCSCFFLGL